MTEARENIIAKLTRSLTGHPDEPPVIDLVEGLYAKAKVLVDMLDDAERNHGALIGSKTLTAANELRLELSKWSDK